MSVIDLDLMLTVFVTLFVVVDPIGVAPIFTALTASQGAARRRQLALKAVLVAFGVLVFFTVSGEWLLARLGISMPAFSTAGGILLLMTGIEMILERRTERRSRAAQKLAEGDEGVGEGGEIALVPLGVPLLAGPGAIATVILLAGANPGGGGLATILIALSATMAASLVTIYSISVVIRKAGDQLAVLLPRLMGILLAALSVQFIFDGLRKGLLAP